MQIGTTLQIIPLYAALLAILFIGLSLHVVLLRRGNRIGLGDGGNRDLSRAIRVHANFAEYVPLALLLLVMLELAGHEDWLLHLFGASLLLGRGMHAWGLRKTISTTPGRLGGVLLTWLVILACSLLLLVEVL